MASPLRDSGTDAFATWITDKNAGISDSYVPKSGNDTLRTG